MTKTLNISRTLKLPIDAVTGTAAVVGMRGVGKTSTCTVLAEEMIDADAQAVIIDPTDAWYGIASSADGKGPGREVYVFGNMRSGHADLQLEPGSGALIADVVVDEGINCVLSMRHLTPSQQREWVRDFASRLYDRKGEPEHRTAVHLFIDEAKEYLPQKGSTVCAEVLTRIVTLGRSSGIGCTLITQRPALVDKDVLSQCETLVAMRTSYNLDRKSLEGWIEAHDPGDRRDEFMKSIASLPVGTAWVWSPGEWDLFQKVAIRPRSTFDSSGTPKAGQQALVPRARATVDLASLGERLAATIARSEEKDPVKLRARVADLERQLAARPTGPDPDTVQYIATLEAEALEAERVLRAVIEHADPKRITQALAGAVVGLDAISQFLEANTPEADATKIGPPAVQPAAPTRTPAPAATTTPPPVPGDAGTLSDAKVAVLGALAQHPEGLTPMQVGILVNRKPRGGAWNSMVAELRREGFLAEGTPWFATDAGRAAVEGRVAPLPTGPELLDHWCRTHLSEAESGILRYVVSQAPRTVTGDEAGQHLGRTPRGGAWNSAVAKLRNLKLIEGWRLTRDFAEAIGAPT